MSASRKYHVALNGQQQGPFSIDEIRARHLDPSTHVWTEGMKEWARLGTIAELSGSTTAGSPVTPPLMASAPAANTGEPFANDPYYDQVAFPAVKEGKSKFNFYAFFFNVMWLGYKGMWADFKKYVVPFAVAIVLLAVFKPSGEAGKAVDLLSRALSIGGCVWFGLMANKMYYQHLKVNPVRDDSYLRAFGALGAYLGLCFCVGFVSAIAFPNAVHHSDRFAQNEDQDEAQDYAANESSESSDDQDLQEPQRNVASVPPSATSASGVYEKVSLAIIDGDAALGKDVHLQGMYMGLQSIEGTPVMMVTDSESASVWLVGFSTKDRKHVASMKPMEKYSISCRVTAVELGANACVMN